MGCAPMSYVLWKEFMAVDPKAPKWFNRDRFVLSAGHGSMLNYSLLHLMGYDSVGVSPPITFNAATRSRCCRHGAGAVVHLCTQWGAHSPPRYRRCVPCSDTSCGDITTLIM